MKLIDTTTTLYTRERAEESAAKMNAGEDDWVYRPVHDPNGTGYSFIEIYDENGDFVATM